MGAAVGSLRYGASKAQGSNPLYYLLRYGGGDASTMDDPVYTINPAEFGSYGNCTGR